MKRHCRGLWQSSLAVGEAENAAVACIVEMKPGIAVVVGSAKTVDVVSRVELKKAAGAGIGAAKTVAVASRLELKEAAADAAAAADIETTTTTTAADAAAAAAAAVGIATTKAAAVAGVLLNILRPHARTGDTGLEQSAADCVAQRVVAGVTGAFGFVVVRRAEVDLQVGNTQQTDMPDSDLDMKGFESDPGHRCTVEY
jgi:hypothetical protein